ncbi:MAG TPA: chemotaxis response regulator protein-glutamate methylesterase [Longimicrobiales bacterium]|nr:chemotaxis response regulator protein-glutamate methylesterase [Longimicrobiales bacterium]
MSREARVLIVDDSPFIRRAVERMLAPLEEVRIVGTAANGREAVEQARRLRPDVVVLDIIMPEMNGLEAIKGIMEEAPTSILVLSSEAQPGADTTLRALELGAVDFVSKSGAASRMDIYDLAPVLREKVLALAGSRVAPDTSLTGPDTPPAPLPDVGRPEPTFEILAVGASTGGPRAITRLISDLPVNFPAGIVVAQHMPPGFTDTLAERLDRRSPLTVREARDGDRVEPGVVLLGEGGKQLCVERDDRGLFIRIPEEGGQFLHRPSVDHLFQSVAKAAGERAMGLVLTGMGQDGKVGLQAIREAGGFTMVESEESAVIYGMPRAALPSADRSLPLDQIGPAIRDILEGKGN